MLSLRRRSGQDLYERQIENSAWANLEEIVGEHLFLIQQPSSVRFGVVPDIVALDSEARVVVIEIERGRLPH